MTKNNKRAHYRAGNRQRNKRSKISFILTFGELKK